MIVFYYISTRLFHRMVCLWGMTGGEALIDASGANKTCFEVLSNAKEYV